MSDAGRDWRVWRPVIVYLTLFVVIAVVCVVAIGIGYLPVIWLERDVRAYRGDGRAAVTSRMETSYGYRIDFEPLDMSKPHHAEYSLEGLPRIDRSARVGVYFDEISDRVYSIRGGTLGVSIAAGDTVVMSAEAPIDDWNFSDQIGIFLTYYNYRTKASSSFELSQLPETGAPKLTVNYVPPPGIDPALRGHVRLQVGGYVD